MQVMVIGKITRGIPSAGLSVGLVLADADRHRTHKTFWTVRGNFYRKQQILRSCRYDNHQSVLDHIHDGLFVRHLHY